MMEDRVRRDAFDTHYSCHEQLMMRREFRRFRGRSGATKLPLTTAVHLNRLTGCRQDDAGFNGLTVGGGFGGRGESRGSVAGRPTRGGLWGD